MKKILSAALAGPLALTAFAVIVAPQASHGASVCPPSAPSIVVPVPVENPNQFGQKLTAVSKPSSASLPVSIPAGSYSAVLTSSDPAHPQIPDQTNERWYAVFSGPSGVVGTTATTPDLPNNLTTQTYPAVAIVLTGNATSVKYFHAGGPGSDGVDSVYAAGLVLNPAGSYPPAPCGPVIIAPPVTTVAPPTTTTPGPTTTTTPGPTTTAAGPTTTTTPGPTTTAAGPTTTAAGPTTTAAAVSTTSTSALGQSNAAAVVVVSASAQAEVATTTTTTAPPAAPATTTARAAAPTVEVQGLQIENAAPAIATTSVQAADVAFTGAQSKVMGAAALAFIALGAMFLGGARKRKTAK